MVSTEQVGKRWRGFGKGGKSLLGGIFLTVIPRRFDELQIKPGEGKQY